MKPRSAGILRVKGMKTLISDEKLYAAFLKARLGSEEYYDTWTPLWALRSEIWKEKRLRKDARKSLGDLAFGAIQDGNSEIFRHIAGALDEMLAFERVPENSLRADIYFAVEELNANGKVFSRADLLTWLNEQLDALVSSEDLDRELGVMGLADDLPAG